LLFNGLEKRYLTENFSGIGFFLQALAAANVAILRLLTFFQKTVARKPSLIATLVKQVHAKRVKQVE
jgi:hypothetical protein